MTVCTLVTGGSALARQQAIAGLIDPQSTTAVILEGGQPGGTPSDPAPLSQASASALLRIETIAAACPCCDGGLVMRVTLDRILRRRPAHLFLSLTQAAHLFHLQQFLLTPPYAALVSLTAPVSCV